MIIEDGIFEGDLCLIRREGWGDRKPDKRTREEGRKEGRGVRGCI